MSQEHLVMTVHFSLQVLLSLLLVFWTGPHKHPGDFGDEGVVFSLPNGDCGTENAAFLPGEEIVYRIYYNLTPLWLAAGEVIFRVEDVGTDYRFTVKAYTYKSYEWFYRGYYDFESRVNKESLMPHLFLRNIEEKKYSKYNKFIFNHETNTVTMWEGKTPLDARRRVLDVSPCIHDMISVMYYMRNMDFGQ